MLAKSFTCFIRTIFHSWLIFHVLLFSHSWRERASINPSVHLEKVFTVWLSGEMVGHERWNAICALHPQMFVRYYLGGLEVPSCLCWFSLLCFSPSSQICFMMNLHISSLRGDTHYWEALDLCLHFLSALIASRWEVFLSPRLGMLIKTVFLLIQLVWYLPDLTK